MLVVAPTLGFLGGQAIQAQRLIELLSGAPGVQLRFLPVNPRLPGPLAALQRIKYVRTVVTSAAYVASLLRRVPECDVVHAFSASYWSFLLAPLPALLVARLFRRLSLLNYRSGEAEDHLQRWRSGRWGVARATRIVVPSGYLVEVFSRFGFEAVAIPNLVDLKRLTYRERLPLRPVFLSNRNFEAHYNVACTLRAFGRIQGQYPDATLLLAGDGPERGSLESLSRSLGLRSVRFIGRVPPDEMGALYDSADLYLNSPHIDNMPTSLIEAFACGLPVVSTSSGGIPYIARHGETARLVPDGDCESLAREACDLLAHSDAALAMARRAHTESAARFARESIEAAWVALYRDLASRRGRAG